jgi:hypothetical protein
LIERPTNLSKEAYFVKKKMLKLQKTKQLLKFRGERMISLFLPPAVCRREDFFEDSCLFSGAIDTLTGLVLILFLKSKIKLGENFFSFAFISIV